VHFGITALLRQGEEMMSSDVRVPKLLTTRQLAEATGIPRWRIHELCAQGKGPPFLRVGRTLRFAEDAVVQWIQDQSNTSHKEET
jgi:excisionase family DNA binding protein